MNAPMILAVAAGGALGSVARYLSMILAGAWLGTAFPWGTLAVNVLGSLVMGVLVESMALFWSPAQEWRAFLTVGLLGGFTTFSTFSMDAALLLERQEISAAALYMLASVLLSVLGLFIGLWAVRSLAA